MLSLYAFHYPNPPPSSWHISQTCLDPAKQNGGPKTSPFQVPPVPTGPEASLRTQHRSTWALPWWWWKVKWTKTKKNFFFPIISGFQKKFRRNFKLIPKMYPMDEKWMQILGGCKLMDPSFWQKNRLFEFSGNHWAIWPSTDSRDELIPPCHITVDALVGCFSLGKTRWPDGSSRWSRLSFCRFLHKPPNFLNHLEKILRRLMKSDFSTKNMT